PAFVHAWLEDGRHFLQPREDQLYKVHALTGRAEPFHDVDKLARSLAALPEIGRATAERMARQIALNMNPQRSGVYFEHQGDLFLGFFDGSRAVRLTQSPGKPEVKSTAPGGKTVAFVRGGNLVVVDMATQKERVLTNDGSDVITNGKADWVYFEEIFNRSWKS